MIWRCCESNPTAPSQSRLLFPAVEIGDSKTVQLLDEIVIIGFPEKGGATVTISEGVIEGKDILGNWIKTDARVIHGNSGGAAVNAEGKLIGIPTKVEADDQEIDKDGDGFPDAKRRYGAVGFLRPAHLVTTMIAQLADKDMPLRTSAPSGQAESRSKASSALQTAEGQSRARWSGLCPSELLT